MNRTLAGALAIAISVALLAVVVWGAAHTGPREARSGLVAPNSSR